MLDREQWPALDLSYLINYTRCNPGDVKPVGSGVSELRIDYGPGYRVYFLQRGAMLIILLAGGHKGTQDQDIRKALELARDV